MFSAWNVLAFIKHKMDALGRRDCLAVIKHKIHEKLVCSGLFSLYKVQDGSPSVWSGLLSIYNAQDGPALV